MAAYLGLTTVRQPLEYSGARGAELLLAMSDGWRPREPVAEKLPLELRPRRTTARIAGEAGLPHEPPPAK
jgi:LacI family transcriptional regulator